MFAENADTKDDYYDYGDESDDENENAQKQDDESSQSSSYLTPEKQPRRNQIGNYIPTKSESC